MNARIPASLFAALVAIAACSKSEPPQPAPPPDEEPSATAVAKPTFINKVWVIADSPQVEIGALRVFLSDGTLVMTSPNSTPAFGAWSDEGGRLTITEEGQKYGVDILSLSENEFRIRINGPGEPILIRFEPAKPVEMAAQSAEPKPAAAHFDTAQRAALWGTAWRLENLAGADVVDRSEATLEFPEEGRASGKGSCNRFNGVVTIEGNTIKFGGLAATRMACADAVMKQEDQYFAALEDAESFELEEQSLSIFAAGRPEPLRFVASDAPAERPVNRIAPAQGGATPAMTGIWTVVAHHIPGTSASTSDQARARHGQTIRLTANAAISPGMHCGQPGYTTSQVATESYLASEFSLAPGSLQPLAGRGQTQLMRVACSGTGWGAFGWLLLEIDADRALTPWDGVFYELRRDRDFRAVGQEPGWQLEIRKGAEIRLTYDYGKGMAVTPAPPPQVDSDGGTRTYHAVTESNDLRAVIVPVSCTDSMSGKQFPATVSVTLNNRTFRGCGEELTTPFQ